MLLQTHQKLDQHFSELSRERATLGYPVYALEHNLEPTEVADLRAALCADLQQTQRLDQVHWLVWTVVAAEIGYAYDGEEYWQSFNAEIPPWVSSIANRETIRRWFREFTQSFNGFQPTGRWAEHFSIIAWPITHSILPKYLQSHFAKHLYDVRHELAAKHGESVDQLGQLLDDRYHGYSSRFENFLQQTALTARLVLALRDEDVTDAVTPIFRPTLTRIVDDLEQRGASRGYLRDARRIMREARLQARRGLLGPSQASASEARPRSQEVSPPSEVKLLARRTQDGAWKLGVALPDFSVAIVHAGVEPGEIDRARVRFSDTQDAWMPGRSLRSYSDSSHWLTKMPNSPRDPLVQFEEPSEALIRLTDALRIGSDPPWLLRIHSDGIARQVLGNAVRPGEDYVVATTAVAEPETKRALQLKDVESKTSAATLYELHVPASAPASLIKGLAGLGLGYSLRARVRSFGLVPRWDEAKACSVWLSNEEVILHVTADFPVSEFCVVIDGQHEARISAAHSPVLAALGILSLGRHVVEVGAVTGDEGGRGDGTLRRITPEKFDIEVRAPSPWHNAAQLKSGLRLIMEPQTASFDDVIERRAAFSLHGPSGRVATVSARLYNVGGHVTESDELGRLAVPASASGIARLIEKLSKDPLSEKIQSSPRVDLTFLVEELGMAAVSFPHKVAPLRWKFTRSSEGSAIRLIDEAGAADSISVSRYDLSCPDVRSDVAAASCIQGIKVSAPGSLYVARLDGKMFAAFVSVPPTGKLTDFTALRTNIALSVPGDSPRSVLRLLALLRIWRCGRPLGPLAAVRKAEVLGLFESQTELLVCGRNWTEKARRYRLSGVPLDQLQRDVGGSPGFASRMRTTEWTWHLDSSHAKQEFFRLAKTYNVCSDKLICDLALTVAFHPSNIRLNDPKQGAKDFEILGKSPILARGAFFAKMTSDLRFARPLIEERAAE